MARRPTGLVAVSIVSFIIFTFYGYPDTLDLSCRHDFVLSSYTSPSFTALEMAPERVLTCSLL